MAKYLIRLGLMSKSEVVELDDDGVKFAKDCGYQVAPMDDPKPIRKVGIRIK
tara:strand:- start:137 stop:292 length:156 start_codon:yes stop_codon:yes gene_type:complete